MKALMILIFMSLGAYTATGQGILAGTSIDWPDSIYTGKQGPFHVQGVAIDRKNGYLYFSFTDKLIKTDLHGRLIGSVTGLVGHLGDLDFNEDNGKVYGALEYKNDAIGKGIRKGLGMQGENKETGFYIAIFDADSIVRPNMDGKDQDVLRTVYLSEVVKDYTAKVHIGNRTVDHRFACSGIDGLAFAPSIGAETGSKKYLYVAYGIYGDTSRNDDDNQVILKYDVENWNRYAQHLSQQHLHHSGPRKPLAKYFVKTGNTNYGIQNLAYDPYTGNLFAAVYHGMKPQYPDYDLFVIDIHQKPTTKYILSDNRKQKVNTLLLLQKGLRDPQTGIRGWHFKWGATGLCPLDNGWFYISHNKMTSDRQQSSTIYKYKWTGREQQPFIR